MSRVLFVRCDCCGNEQRGPMRFSRPIGYDGGIEDACSKPCADELLARNPTGQPPITRVLKIRT